MHWIWNPDPLAFTVGNIGISWYGLLWALGFFIAQRLVIFMYRKERKPGRDLDALLIYLIVGTVAGARLIHCLFYDPGYYARDPISVVKIWEGGLSSHGAALGILTALFVFSRRKKDQPLFWLVDRIAIVAAIVGGLVRVGNFINSEIIGTRTNSSSGVVFVAPVREAVLSSDSAIEVVEIRGDPTRAQARPGLVPLTMTVIPKDSRRSDQERSSMLRHVETTLLNRGDAQANVQLERVQDWDRSQTDGVTMSLRLWGIARHPVQLYEATVYLLLAGGLFAVWWKRKGSIPHGHLLGWFMVVTFGSRILLEHLKAPVTSTDSQLPMSIGQMFSIPFALAGFILLWRARQRSEVVSAKDAP